MHDGESFNSDHDIVEELGTAVIDKNYGAVKNILSNSMNVDPNLEINFLGGLYMTALEFSVHKGDWKMTLLLFLNGADPSYNCFDGAIKSENTCTTRFHHAFKSGEYISGFEGLRALIGNSEDSNVMVACLWLMEFADGDIRIASSTDVVKVLDFISILFQNLENINAGKQDIIEKGIGYIMTCCRGIMARVKNEHDYTVLNDEWFEIVLFSLRIIVLHFINLSFDDNHD